MMENTINSLTQVEKYMGTDAENLLTYRATGIPKEKLTLPGPLVIDNVFNISDRNVQVLKSLSSIYHHGRLSGTGYLSILPVDQGIEHTAGSSFASNPDYFDPENIIKLAVEGGCNGVVRTFGGLSLHARKYAHKVPFIVKINHNELLTYPNKYDQVMFGSVEGVKLFFKKREIHKALNTVFRDGIDA